jgi:hypothetical protein
VTHWEGSAACKLKELVQEGGQSPTAPALALARIVRETQAGDARLQWRLPGATAARCAPQTRALVYKQQGLRRLEAPAKHVLYPACCAHSASL